MDHGEQVQLHREPRGQQAETLCSSVATLKLVNRHLATRALQVEVKVLGSYELSPVTEGAARSRVFCRT